MDNTEYVHKRDITTIFSQLHDDVKGIEKNIEESSIDQKQIEDQINELITNADRDLRLKTQAIMRTKLGYSNVLPLSCSIQSIKANNATTPASPIVKPKVASSDIKTNPLIASNANSNQNSFISSTNSPPITPLRRFTPVKDLKICKRAATAKTPYRKREIPTRAMHDLPVYNWHDPAQPPPPIPKTAINTYGLNRLVESRLIPESALKDEFKGLLKTFPLKSEPKIYNSSIPNYKMDEDNPKTLTKIFTSIKPTTPTIKINFVKSLEEEEDLTGKFVFTLKNGVPDPLDPEFINFKRQYSDKWEEVSIVLDMLRLMCERNCQIEQKVIGSVVIELTELDPDSIPPEKLMTCFINRTTRRGKKKNPKYGFGFIGPNKEAKAAIVIQSIWRGFYARRFVREIKRNQIASRIIHRFWKKANALKVFREHYKNEFKKRLRHYENNHSHPTIRDDIPFVVVQLMEKHSGSYFGRCEMLSNPNCIVVVYTRKTVPISHIENMRSICSDYNRIQFIASQEKLPSSLPIEDVLACDARSLAKIRTAADRNRIFILPSHASNTVIEIAYKLSALAIMPSTNRIMIFQTHEAVRRLLKSANVKLFECSDEIFDKNSLCKALCALAVTHLSIQQWRIRVSSGVVGWVNTSDFTLLERLKANSDILTEKDLDDENFLKLLEQSLASDLNVIVETIRTKQRVNLLREVWMNGALVVEGPRQTKASPEVAFYIPLSGSPKIIGTWEVIFLSLYEPFAAIYPSFSVDTNKLKKTSMKIAEKFSEKQMIGYNVIKYWYSTRAFTNSLDETKIKMALTADDVCFMQYEEILPLFLLEQILGRKFDENTMSFGQSTYAYVQEHCELPQPIDQNDLMNKLQSVFLPTENKVKMFQDFTSPSSYTLLVIEESPSALINLVYRVMTVLIDVIFSTSLKGTEPLFEYIHAIEYLKKQIDEGELTSTAYMEKVKIRDWRKKDRFFDDEPEDDNDESHPQKEVETSKQNIMSENSYLNRIDLFTPTTSPR